MILAGVFLAITLARVAGFTAETMSAGIVFGWLFSVGLGVAVYASSYWTRNQTTRKSAVVALAFFILVDAFFNFAHVWMTAAHSSGLATTGAVLYGLFPTAAVALLAWMQTSVNKLPPGATGAKRQRLTANIYDWLADKFAVSANAEIMPFAETKPEPTTSEPEAKPARFVCGCGRSFATQNGLNAHQKRHKVALSGLERVEVGKNGNGRH